MKRRSKLGLRVIRFGDIQSPNKNPLHFSQRLFALIIAALGFLPNRSLQVVQCISKSAFLRPRTPATRAVLTTTLALLLLPGCVAATKKARTIHERFDYTVCPASPGHYVAMLTCHEIWRDESRGGVHAFLSDPKASALVSLHTNQAALGGGSSLEIGSIESTVSTNAVRAIADSVSQVVSETVSKIIVPKL